MLDLVGVETRFRFKLNGEHVQGARGARTTVTARVGLVRVNGRGKAFSVVVSGRQVGPSGRHGNAIFYPQDFASDPVAGLLVQAAESEWAILSRSTDADQI